MKKFAIFIVFQILFPIYSYTTSIAADISSMFNGNEAIITINGEISSGDYSKFIKVSKEVFARSTAIYKFNLMTTEKENPERIAKFKSKFGQVNGLADVTVELNSNGGNALESMQIGNAIQDMALNTKVTANNQKKSQCMSSCFFIWVAGIERTVLFDDISKSIGIHRVYYDQDYYKKLSSEQAEIEYKKVVDTTESYLKKMRVPDNIKEKIFNIPSNEIYWLTKDEIENIEGMSPYYHELIISKCGSQTKEDETNYLDCIIIRPRMHNGNFKNLEKHAKISIENKCNAMSVGYLSNIEERYKETRSCLSINNSILRWERMAKYLGFTNLMSKQ